MAIQIDQAEINSIRLKEQPSDVASTDSGYGQLYVKNDGVYFKATGTTYMIKDVGARVYRTTDIGITGTISSTPYQIIPFDAEHWDTDNIHSTGTNTSRLTCNTPGKYMIYGHLGFEQATDERFRTIDIILNGNSNFTIARQRYSSCSGFTCDMSISTIWNLNAGDYVELRAQQQSGATLLAKANFNYNSLEFGMQKID